MGAPTTGRETLEIAVLGPLEVRRNGRAVLLGSPQQRAVLARLVCSVDRIVSTDRLVEAVWGHHPSPGVVTSLQTHVFHLRQVLEPDRLKGAPATVLVTEAGGYRLAVPPDAVDATRFERLVHAADSAPDPVERLRLLDEGLALWRGDVLVDVERHQFVEAFAASLVDLRVVALEAHLQPLLDLGQDARALAEADRLVTAYPLREGPYAQRMLALYRTGRQTDALAAYRDLRTLLDDELGIEPGPPLRTLHARILAQDPELTGPPPPPPAPVAGPAPGVLLSAAQDREPWGPTPSVAEPSKAGGVSSSNLPKARTLVRTRPLLAATLGVAVLWAATLVARTSGEATTFLSANSVGLLDLEGHVLGGVGVGTSPSALAEGGGALWVANESDDTVMRVDPANTRVTQRFDVGDSPEALATTGDDVWVANFGDGTVSRISMIAQRVVQTVTVGTNPAALAADQSILWVANSADNTVQRIDTRSGHAGPAIGVGDGPDGLLVDGRSLWVANGRDGTVSHLDAATGAEVSSPVQVGSGPRGVIRFGGDVWVADELSQSVSRVSVSTGRVRPVYVADGPTSLAVLDGAVWVAERYAGSFTRIDPVTGGTSSVRVGAEPRAALVSGERLWVAAGANAATGHRGGTLTVAAVQLPGSLVPSDLPGDFVEIEPAFVYDIPTYQAERLVYEGLVATRYSPIDSQTLVPSLAVRIPRASDGGRTYTFQLRPGVRYSTGAAVVASDFRRGLERVGAVGPATLYRQVLGMPACIEKRAQCDLSAGVETDDAAGRVSFHLSTPDPDLLHKLASLVFPLPAQFEAGVTGPQPGTGPYAVAEYAGGTAFVLRRNPFFRLRSVSASPQGYPDEIRWLKVDDLRAVADAVVDGRADVGNLTPLGDRTQSNALVADLRVSHAAQVHSQPALSTDVVILNSSVPPFDHLLARQALNYAVDRRVLADLVGGPLIAVPSCQLLPPTFPSYRPFCPYTTGSLDGTYHGPNLERALTLVEDSGTMGGMVTVLDVVGDYNPRFEDYMTSVLRSLGYRVTERRVPDTAANETAFYTVSTQVHVVSGGWIPDYPGPSTFYDGLVRCHTVGYPTGYCNVALDRRADAAQALQATDPGESLRQWTAVDHDVALQAPLVFGASEIAWWVTSQRVGNYESSPYLGGPLLSQLWVR